MQSSVACIPPSLLSGLVEQSYRTKLSTSPSRQVFLQLTLALATQGFPPFIGEPWSWRSGLSPLSTWGIIENCPNITLLLLLSYIGSTNKGSITLLIRFIKKVPTPIWNSIIILVCFWYKARRPQWNKLLNSILLSSMILNAVYPHEWLNCQMNHKCLTFVLPSYYLSVGSWYRAQLQFTRAKWRTIGTRKKIVASCSWQSC